MFEVTTDPRILVDFEQGLRFEATTGAYDHQFFILSNDRETVNFATIQSSRMPTDSEIEALPGLQSVLKITVASPFNSLFGLPRDFSRRVVAEALTTFFRHIHNNPNIPVDIVFQNRP